MLFRSGDIISQVETPIDPMETVGDLHDRLAQLGAALLVETVAAMAEGKATRTIQDTEKVSFAPMLSRDMSQLDVTRNAKALHNQVRGLVPWPGAELTLADRKVKIWNAFVGQETTEKEPGTILVADERGIALACGEGSVLVITELQAQGKRRMAVGDYLRGNPIV